MDIQYIKEVADVLDPFMKQNNFEKKGGEVGRYHRSDKEYKIDFDDSKNEFSLSVAAIDADGNPGSFKVIDTWFFSESDHGPNDTICIGEDFMGSIAADAGIKVIKTSEGVIKEVALPEKASAGTEPGIEAFTQKFLAMFPQYKECYKDMVAKYGDFLYVEFFKKYGVEKMKELMSDEVKNKKLLNKYWTVLGDMHYNGEMVVGDLICTVILAGSFGKDPEKYTAAAEKYLVDYPFLKTAGAFAVKNYKSDKKLRQILDK